jgi:hypothetical protein
VGSLKDILLQAGAEELQSSQFLILLDIFLNICIANKGRIRLIEHGVLKNILAHISEVKGSNTDEIRLMVTFLLVNYPLIKVFILDLRLQDYNFY